MKLLRCDGRFLEVYDVAAPALMRLVAGPAPIKAHGWRLLEDDAAREVIKRVMREGALKEEARQ